MAIAPADASAAYRANAVKIPGAGQPSEPSDMAGANSAVGGFSELLKGAAKEAITANREAEATAALGIAGRAELADVVSAMSHAERTLTTVVRVRDRMISAYQQILRMPI